MPTCPTCGAATAPAQYCGACGHPLPAGSTVAAPAVDPTSVRLTGSALLAVGCFMAAAGFVLLGYNALWVDFGFDFLAFPSALTFAGIVVIVAGAALVARQKWGWGLAVGVVAFGIVYAVTGLARGYTSGLIGIGVWGGLAWGLALQDVRGAVGIA